MMTMLHLIDDSTKLAAQLLSQPHAKEFRDPVGSQSPKADLAAALENLMDWEVAFEDEVAAVLDLPDGVEARQVDLFALPLGKLWSQDQRPIVQLL
jgi:3-polyprenyl-4-hydroxybenzoate decarboxylase